MKTYLLDDSENQYSETGLFLYKVVTSIVHFQSSDFKASDNEQVLPPEHVKWTEDKLLLELSSGDKVISGIPGVEIRREAVYNDGRRERLETLSLDVTTLYSLYQHLKNIDEFNPDGLMW